MFLHNDFSISEAKEMSTRYENVRSANLPFQLLFNKQKQGCFFHVSFPLALFIYITLLATHNLHKPADG